MKDHAKPSPANETGYLYHLEGWDRSFRGALDHLKSNCGFGAAEAEDYLRALIGEHVTMETRKRKARTERCACCSPECSVSPCNCACHDIFGCPRSFGA